MQKRLNVLVTGGNRGIGLNLLKAMIKDPQFHTDQLLFTVRTTEKGKQTLQTLNQFISENSLQKPKKLDFYIADMASKSQLSQLTQKLQSQGIKLNLLVLNAGMVINEDHYSFEKVRRTMEVNFYGQKNLFELMHSDKILQDSAQVSFISSIGGTLSILKCYPEIYEQLQAYLEPEFTMNSILTVADRYIQESKDPKTITLWPNSAYRMSKVLLSVYVYQLAQQHSKDYFLQSLCPGWCKTDMGGPRAPKSPEQGASDLLYAIKHLKNPKLSGRFFYNRQLCQL